MAGYAYTLAPTGHRLSVTELNGRAVSYAYDALYRLTGETIGGDAQAGGRADYTYDAVGNRLTRAATVPGLAPTTSTYDANDRLHGDTYDLNVSTGASDGVTYGYDFEGRLASVGGGAVSYTYDGDGNRVAKTAGGVTTHYLVDTNNHTGYAQVVEELRGGQVVRQYTCGHDLVSQRQLAGGQWQTSFYGYDGHGSVRYLTDPLGVVTDTYAYDSFGNLLARTGATPNNYLFAGERLDPETGLYYLRARHMNTRTGRFWTMDGYEGHAGDPPSLHKYLYGNADPVNNIDPTGNFSIAEMTAAGGMTSTIIAAVRALNAAMRVYNFANRVVDTISYVNMGADVLTALGEPTPALVRTALEARLRRHFGEWDLLNFSLGFEEVLGTLGPNWAAISQRIELRAPDMAAEIMSAGATIFPGMLVDEAAGRLGMIFYGPTIGPATGRRRLKDARDGERYMRLRRNLYFATSLGGGRLFGVGAMRSGGMAQQIFRIDYWDERRQRPAAITTPLHVHYHVFSDKHPPGRTIWP